MVEGSKKQGRPVALGVALILIGVFFLADRAGIVEFSWPLILLAIGVAIIAGAGKGKRADVMFPGTLLFLLGLVFLLEHNTPWFHGGWGDAWPLLIIAVGLAFIVSYFANTSKGTGPLIPGVVLIGLGFLFFLATYNVIHWTRLGNFIQWWPLILVLVGIWLLVKRKK